MQRAIIVDGYDTVTKLNDYLKAGANVVHVCPMPSSASASASPNTFQNVVLQHRRSALVIVEGSEMAFILVEEREDKNGKSNP